MVKVARCGRREEAQPGQVLVPYQRDKFSIESSRQTPTLNLSRVQEEDEEEGGAVRGEVSWMLRLLFP